MTVSFNQNYFQLFEIEQSVFIDFNILEEKYLELQKEFHPDKYVNASEQEKRLSIQITSYINEAYNTLKNDYLKSVYLLKIEGYEFEDQNNTISDTEFNLANLSPDPLCGVYSCTGNPIRLIS